MPCRQDNKKFGIEIETKIVTRLQNSGLEIELTPGSGCVATRYGRRELRGDARIQIDESDYLFVQIKCRLNLTGYIKLNRLVEEHQVVVIGSPDNEPLVATDEETAIEIINGAFSAAEIIGMLGCSLKRYAGRDYGMLYRWEAENDTDLLVLDLPNSDKAIYVFTKNIIDRLILQAIDLAGVQTATDLLLR